MAIKVFTSELIRTARYQEAIDIDMLATAFKKYKTTGVLPGIFGRDEAYMRPPSIVFLELQHIHTNLKEGWKINRRQYNRVSNSALIYCQGELSKDNYLLIAYLDVDAHDRANKVTYMLELGEIAENFKKRF